MEDLSFCLDKIFKSVQNVYSENAVFENVISCVSSLFDVDIVFIDRRGNMFKKLKREDINSLRFDYKRIFTNGFDYDINEISETKNYEYFVYGYYAFAAPVVFAGRNLGVVFVYGKEIFSRECIICVKSVCMFLSGIIFGLERDFERKKNENREIVRSAFGTLSYSEFEAILGIFDELKSDEGVLIMKKLGERLNITRSVIVNAIKKVESAGIIESRSLGMKGTYIKVLNRSIFDEIKKIKK